MAGKRVKAAPVETIEQRQADADFYAKLILMLEDARFITEKDMMVITERITTRFQVPPYKPPTAEGRDCLP